MTIEYDPEKKRATHVESGMAVEFLGYGPRSAQERDLYFNLIFNQKTEKINASYDSGIEQI
jgi:hypothetical protein